MLKQFFKFFDSVFHPPKKASKRRILKRRIRSPKTRRKLKKAFKTHPRIKRTPKTRKTLPAKKHAKQIKLETIGIITHYFPKVNAAVVELKRSMCIGEPIRIKGKITDFCQTVGSMQIDRKPIEKAKKGQEIGLEVFKEVHPGDLVYLST